MRQWKTTSPLAEVAKRVALRLGAFSFVTRCLILGLLTMAVSGVVHAIAQPARDSSETPAELVESIVAGHAHLDQVPDGFAGDMGYVPVERSGTLLHPAGGCSTPGGIGPDRFAEACQIHDLGYDVLRYAEIEGVRLSAKARLELDWKLYVDMLETCHTPTCSLTATAYYSAVSANSIRQGYKTPRAEPAGPWMALTVAVVGLSAAGGLPSMREKLGSDAIRRRG